MALASQLHLAHHALGDNLMGKQDLPQHCTLRHLLLHAMTA